jgi:hypothetical protein
LYGLVTGLLKAAGAYGDIDHYVHKGFDEGDSALNGKFEK